MHPIQQSGGTAMGGESFSSSAAGETHVSTEGGVFTECFHAKRKGVGVVGINGKSGDGFFDQCFTGSGMVADQERKTETGGLMHDGGIGVLAGREDKDIGGCDGFLEGVAFEKSRELDVTFKVKVGDEGPPPAVGIFSNESDHEGGVGELAKSGGGSKQEIRTFACDEFSHDHEGDRRGWIG